MAWPRNIPLCAQAVGICDVHDALTTPRVYKNAFSHEKAVDMILHGECGVFNPQMLECFCDVLEEFRECARTYADAENSPSASDIQFPEPLAAAAALKVEKEKMATAKYQALCQLINGVVVEADMDKGTDELVYDAGGQLDFFRHGLTINQTMMELLNTGERRGWAWPRH